MEHSVEPRFPQHRFGKAHRLRSEEERYGVGDVVVWDNAALLHSATLTDPDDARTLWRITVLEVDEDAAAPAGLAMSFAASGAQRP